MLDADWALLTDVLGHPPEALLEKPAGEITSPGQYFGWTAWLYRLFHSREGAMHLPVYLPDGNGQHYEALQTQVRYLTPLLSKQTRLRVLEMGCGMGYNSHWLARHFPEHQFWGLDASLSHLRQARAMARYFRNLHFVPGNYHAPEAWPGPMHLIFAIESFCYVQDVEGVLAALAKNLSPGGHLVIFDAFAGTGFAHCSLREQQAQRLSALSFAVRDWWPVEIVKQKAAQQGLQLQAQTDYSAAVLPNLIRFQEDMRKTLGQYKPWFAWAYRRGVLPKAVFLHIMGGLLGAHTMASPAQRYYLLHWQKKMPQVDS
ncbi:MAG: hypothetical protein OHK0053_24510 [Microscillaceae bacterium]